MTTTTTPPPRLSEGPAQALMSYTYYALRWSLALLAILLPPMLLIGDSVVHGSPLPQSISGYYHTPMRTVWTAVLTLIASFLYLYKGFSDRENHALNLAGLGVAGVVMFPCARDQGATDPIGFTWPVGHGLSALLAFGSIGVVAIFFAADTLDLVANSRTRARYRLTYRVLGALMVALPLLTALALVGHLDHTFWVESVAVWVFAAYWLVKTVEFRGTSAEKLALSGTLPSTGSGASTGLPLSRG